MSPAVEAYFTGAQTDRVTRLVWIPRNKESITQQTFARTAKALRVPLTSEKLK